MPLHNPAYVRMKKEMRKDIKMIRAQHPIFTITYIGIFLFLVFLGWWMLGIWGSLVFIVTFAIALLYEYMS